jgi:hypothetical protein
VTWVQVQLGLFTKKGLIILMNLPMRVLLIIHSSYFPAHNNAISRKLIVLVSLAIVPVIFMLAIGVSSNGL